MLRKTNTEIGTISFRRIWVLTIFFLTLSLFPFLLYFGEGGGGLHVFATHCVISLKVFLTTGVYLYTVIAIFV